MKTVIRNSYTPKLGDYCNTLVVDKETGKQYIFDKDGVWTLIKASTGDFYTKSEVDEMVGDEATAREDEDDKIWDEIDKIKMSSDVVDVVGTYADLLSYDTSSLNDNDLIKVLQDSTHDDAISYYRWDIDTGHFSYVGSEGPYYTQDQTDALVNAKASYTIFYANTAETSATRHVYKKSDMTDAASVQDIIDANNAGPVVLRASTAGYPNTYNDFYLQNAFVTPGNSDYEFVFLDDRNMDNYSATSTSDTTFDFWRTTLQAKLTAGSNITINGSTISATDTNTTYTAGNGLSLNGTEFSVNSNVVALQSDIPTAVSDLDNDSGFITNSVNDLSNYYLKTDTYTQNEVNSLIGAITVPTKTSDLINDGADNTSTYVEADELATVATSGSYNDLLNKPTIMAGLVEMSYGESNAWAKFIAAYQAKQIVYCRASSNSNPATGTQGRKAFMAYVNNAENPTEVEFQYVRSVSSKSSSQPVDQVFVYKLTNVSGGTWTVETRNMAPKLAQGTNTTVSYSSGTYTISATQPTVNDATLTIQKNGTTVGTFTANAASNVTANISVPTATSDLTNDSGFISSDTVCNTGDSITISDAIEDTPLHLSQLLGNTTQTGTPTPSTPIPVETVTGQQTVTIAGKNLIEDTIANGTIDSAGKIGTNASFKMLSARVQEGQTYTITSSNGFVGGFFTSKPAINSVSYNGQRTAQTGQNIYTVTAPITGWICFRANADDSTPQFELGPTATAYEAPNITSYEINLGKNLMPTADADLTQTRQMNFTISLEPGTYTISYDLSDITLGTNAGVYVGMQLNGSDLGANINITGVIDSSTLPGRKTYTFTTATPVTASANSNIRLAQTYWDNGARLKISNIQIERGSAATSYAAYVTPTELCKIGTAQDYIWNDDGTWKIHKETATATYDGSENWDIYKTGTTSFYYRYTGGVSGITENNSSNLISNYGRPASITNSNTANGITLIASVGEVRIRYGTEMTVANWKLMLDSNNMVLYYPIATPTDTAITDAALIAQLDVINSASLNEGTNNIMLIPSAGAQGGIRVCYSDISRVAITGRYSDLIGARKTLRVRMTGYDTEELWYIDRRRSSFNVGYDEYTHVPDTEYITAKEVPGPTFENEDTGAAIELEEIFEALEAGTEVIFDGLPLGWDLTVGSTDEENEAPQYDPVRVNRLTVSSAIADSDGVYTFAGCAPVPMSNIAIPLCFFIDKHQYAPETPGDDPEIVYGLTVQGSIFIQPPA